MTGAPATTTRATLISAWGLFAALALLMLGNGLLGVLIGVRSELEGFNTTVTGLIMASYFVGFLAGSQFTPPMMARVGHIRVFAGLTSVVAAIALIHALAVTPLSWALLRLVFGFGMAGLYVVVESWLNDTVSNINRGRVMAIYMVVAMGGLGLGQLVISFGDPLQATLFIVAGVFMVLAVAPVSLSINEAPYFELPPRAKYRDLWEAAPLGVITAVGSGVAMGAIVAMAGVYATQIGLTTRRTGLFVAAAAVGSVVLQWPIGQMSDRTGRRSAILVTTLAALVVGGLAPTFAGDSWPLISAMFLLGGFSYPLYSLALSHVVDVLPPGRAVTASAAVVFMTAVGSIVGPLVASVVMDAVGPDGFFWSIAAVHGGIGVYGIIGLLQRRTIPALSEEPYLPVPARSTFVLRRGRRHKGL
ncbi:MAG TPA: MFS transporter [Acidimicrobiia bacterium]|jgi:MFS family permease|nr:MFS transporter [Acidimicrobiia bacterium]